MSCSARDAACCRPECAGCDSRHAREQVCAGCLNFPALRDGGIHSREEVAPDPGFAGTTGPSSSAFVARIFTDSRPLPAMTP